MNNEENSLKRNKKNHKTKILNHDNNMNKEIQSKLKILNKYFKLDELKQQEKISKFEDGFIDQSEKPIFYFMRSELKIKQKDFFPATNLSSSKRNKTFSTLFKKNLVLKGFRNHLGRKLKTEVLPTNFEEIQAYTEERKNNLMKNNYLLSGKKYKISDKNIIKLKLRNDDSENINFLKNKSSENYQIFYNKNDYSNSNKEELTKSIILKNSKNYKLNNNDIDNNKKKRPITSKGKRKIFLGLINNNENKMVEKINRKKRAIKSAYSDRTRTIYSYREKNFNKNNYTNNSNKNISCYTTTFKSFSKSLSSRKKINNTKLFKDIEKKVLNQNKFLIESEKNEFKTTNQIIKRILNDCNIIDKYIKIKTNSKNKENNDKEAIILNLADKLKKNELKYLKSKVKSVRKIIDEDEKIFEEKLKKIPKLAKKFFREVYKQILFEKRILNKIVKTNIIDVIEEKQTRKKFNNQFKEEAKQTMIITKENLVTEKDDKILLEEQRKLFDFYDNLDGLEWLINKKQIMNFGSHK